MDALPLTPASLRRDLRVLLPVGLACILVGATDLSFVSPSPLLNLVRALALAHLVLGLFFVQRWSVRGRRAYLWAGGALLPLLGAASVPHADGPNSVALAMLLLFMMGTSVAYPGELGLVVITCLVGTVAGGLALIQVEPSTAAVRAWLPLCFVMGTFSLYGARRFRRLSSEPALAASARRLTEGLAAGAFLRFRTEPEVLDAAQRVLQRQGLSTALVLIESEQFYWRPSEQVRPWLRWWLDSFLGDASQRRYPLASAPRIAQAIAERAPSLTSSMAEAVLVIFPRPLRLVMRWVAPRQGLFVPLFVEDKPYAILGIGVDDGTAVDRQVLRLFGRHVETALENVRAHARLAEQLAQAERLRVGLLANERLATLGSTAAMVAHEIHAPLARVSAALEELGLEQGVSPPSRETLAMMREETKRLSALTRNLSYLAKPQQPLLAPVDLGELARRSVSAVLSAQGEMPVPVEQDTQPGCVVRADAGQLQMAIENLVRNALQASPKGGKVRVGVAAVPGGVVLFVDDQGPGVPDELRARVFDPFFTTRVAGTGLGLSIVQRVAAAHGTRVEVKTGELGGARFELRLPSR